MTLQQKTRSRLTLLLIAVFFLGSFAVAATLFFGGWRPPHTRNVGEMLDPYPDLRTLSLQQADGQPWTWQPATRHWHVIVAPPADCGAPCAELLDALRRVWISEGRHAEIIFEPLRVDRARLDWADAAEHQRDDHSLLVTSIEASPAFTRIVVPIGVVPMTFPRIET